MAQRRDWLEARAERLAQGPLIAATDTALKRLWARFDDNELSQLARGLEVGPRMRSPEQSEAVNKLAGALEDWQNAL